MLSTAHPGESVTNPFSSPSPKLWGVGSTPFGKGLPANNIIIEPSWKLGHHLYEDFTDFPLLLTNTAGIVKGWNYFLSNGALIADALIANLGAASFSSDGDNEAAILAKPFGSIQIAINSRRAVFFETRVQFSTIASSKNGAFFGLWTPLTPTATSHIADDGTLTDNNFIGFHRLEGTGGQLNFVWKAAGQAQQTIAAVATLLAATWVKVGFAFDGTHTLYVFVNGQEVLAARLSTAQLSAITFPSAVTLSPVIVGAKNATGTAPGSNNVNWARFGYTNAPADGFTS